jgi:hypothetical protein
MRWTMPRKRMPVVNQLASQLPQPMTINTGVKKVGRPRKLKKPENYEDVTITPVANGYVVTSTTTGKNMFVFEDLDKTFDFIRSALKPTAEQSEFLGKV